MFQDRMSRLQLTRIKARVEVRFKVRAGDRH